MKKFGTVALSLALAASLAATALAANDLLIAPNPNAAPPQVVPVSAPVSYTTALTLNGKTLDTAGIPLPSAPDMLPLRLVAESDYGSASWFEEENTGYFHLDGARITVNFADNSILLNDEAVEGTAEVIRGVTFVPAAVLNGVKGYEITGEGDSLTITTPNNAPLVKLAYSIQDGSEMARGMKSDIATFAENYNLPEGTFAEGVAFFGMNTTPDCLVLAKLSEGADVEAVKAALESYRQVQADTFSWYLSHNLPKVEAAKTVVNGDYVLFLIAENSEKGVELFNEFVAAQK